MNDIDHGPGDTRPPGHPPSPPHPKGNGHALPPIPDPCLGYARDGARVGSLPQLVADLRLLTAKAFALTSHQWDPTSGPQQQDVPLGPDWVDIQMCEVRADLRAALTTLDALRDLLTQRPVFVAPDRPTPGYAITDTPVMVSRGSGDLSPEVACPNTRGVWSRDAGASSGPRQRPSPRAPYGDGAMPGVGFAMGAAPMGFALPKTPRFSCT